METNAFKLARTKYNKHGFQSVETVSKITGISRSMIEDLESPVGSKRGVSYLKVADLAKHYGVPSDYLLGLIDVPSQDVDIQKVVRDTGLSLKSIDTLKTIHETDKTAKNPGAKYEYVETLNCLLENEGDFWPLVWISRFLSVPDIVGTHYVTVDGEVKEQIEDFDVMPHGMFCEIDRETMESFFLQRLNFELMRLKEHIHIEDQK